MFTLPEFIRIITIEHGLIATQTAGLSTADTLIQPQPTGNCMNWVLGHLLESKLEMLELLEGRLPIARAELAIYKRESEPVSAGTAGIWSLERLLEGHEQVQAALLERLNAMSEADFAREIPWRTGVTTVGWRVLFLNFHFTYHAGQLELLRQMAGRSEKLI